MPTGPVRAISELRCLRCGNFVLVEQWADHLTLCKLPAVDIAKLTELVNRLENRPR